MSAPERAVVVSVIVKVLISVLTIVAPLFIVTLPNLPFMVIVSLELSPSVTFPLRVEAPVTDKSPPTAVSPPVVSASERAVVVSVIVKVLISVLTIVAPLFIVTLPN